MAETSLIVKKWTRILRFY